MLIALAVALLQDWGPEVTEPPSPAYAEADRLAREMLHALGLPTDRIRVTLHRHAPEPAIIGALTHVERDGTAEIRLSVAALGRNESEIYATYFHEFWHVAQALLYRDEGCREPNPSACAYSRAEQRHADANPFEREAYLVESAMLSLLFDNGCGLFALRSPGTFRRDVRRLLAQLLPSLRAMWMLRGIPSSHLDALAARLRVLRAIDSLTRPLSGLALLKEAVGSAGEAPAPGAPAPRRSKGVVDRLNELGDE